MTYVQPHIFLRKHLKRHYIEQLSFSWLTEKVFIKRTKNTCDVSGQQALLADKTYNQLKHATLR